MGRLRVSRPSLRGEHQGQIKLKGLKSEKHPVDTAGWWSYATFSWMSKLMYSSYKVPLEPSSIPAISAHEACRLNTDILEGLWTKEISLKTIPKLRHVLWKYVRKTVLLTTCFFLVAIILGFFSSVILLKRVLDFASDRNGTLQDGVIRVSLLIICELLRVFFFTLTWALSYRTAIRLKSACMGLVYRKLFRLANINDSYGAKVQNLISSDCHRIYEVVVSTQVAIGGPLIIVLGSIYIAWELGFISLVGMLVFPASYPIQYLLAKGSASLKRMSMNVKDTRVLYLTESLQSLKFLKMFAWEKYFARLITETRALEKLYLLKSQILHSFSIVLSPMLPHVGAITTFILYINAGNELTPAQAFCVIALYMGSIRGTLNTVRIGFRTYLESLIAMQRIQGFTTLFLFSLFFYATRTISRLLDLKHSFFIATTRLESLLILPEVQSQSSTQWAEDDVENSIVIENLSITRKCTGDTGSRKSDSKKNKKTKSSRSRKTKEVKIQVKSKLTTADVLDDTLMGSTESDLSTFQLENLNVQIKKGSFIGICGHVGSGKSTFLEAVAGSIAYEKGVLDVFGKIAYAPQEPWIFKGTLRDNVTFGEVFEPVRYYNAINSCCLVNDLGSFGQGDLTLASERGCNLSGGQKQRLSLARALYHFPMRDIYLLDDPLSGLDDRVAKTIFEKVILEQLRENKTVVLVTHQLQYLRECDEILVFSDGQIVERGTHSMLMSRVDSQYSSLVAASAQQSDSQENQNDIMMEDSVLLDTTTGSTESSLNQIASDQNFDWTSKGDISWGAYSLYIKNAGGPLAIFLVLAVFALNIGSTAFSSWWLKNWFRDSSTSPLNRNMVNLNNYSTTTTTTENYISSVNETLMDEGISRVPLLPRLVINSDSPNFLYYRNVYAGIIGVIFLTSFIRTLLFVFTSLQASQNIHKKLVVQFFRNRLKSTERFGTGQILHLFTRDMAEVDCGLPHSLEFFLQNIFIVISILTMVSIIFPVFLAPLLLLFGVFLLFRRVYNSAIRDLKRFESDAKTPIFTCVHETVSGMGTIRAFGKENQMINSFEELTDWNNSVFYIFLSAIRWLSFRLDTLAVSVTAITAILILVFNGRVSPASAGLALSYAAQLSGIFQFTVRMASEVEAKFVCVERMNNFLISSQSEEPIVEGSSSSERKLSVKVPLGSTSHTLMTHPNWPYAGRLKFDAVTLSYSSSKSEPVLKELSFEVREGTKIGIIGRTGSGKSSIGNALFRLTELKSGSIYLDDVNIAEVPLAKLRNSLCVIPQDPAIFQQSARFNLDPGNLHSDHDLWTVLEKVGLKSSVESLDSEVALSQGQKQLLSIARAILRQSVLIFVDEATSNVDVETASIIDRVIVQEFSGATVLVVAHRLQALKYCEYLLVMEDGELRDFGPVDLITRTPGFLSHFEKFETIPL